MARKYAEEEIAAAWEAAEHFPGEDPAKVRIDNVLNVGAALHRENYDAAGNRRGGGYWEIDDRLRARHAGYRLTEAKHAQRVAAEQAEHARSADQRSANQVKAEAAGLPNSEIYDRLDALEKAVQEIRNGVAR